MPASELHFDEYQESCSSHDECDVGQQCTFVLWDGTQDGQSWGNGSACYSWDEDVCPSDEQFGSVNENYNGGTEFSSYTQFQCPGSDGLSSGAFSLTNSSNSSISTLSNSTLADDDWYIENDQDYNATDD